MARLPKLPVLLLAGALVLISCPLGLAAPDADKIRQLIEASEIVPTDYREHINIVTNQESVLISVYKDPEAQPNDCKIDAILMAKKVMEAAPATRTVSVFFYDLGSDDKLLQVDVPTSAVASFASGQLTKAGVLRAARLAVKQSNTLATSYGGKSYKDIIARLGVIEGPAQHQRALSLVRIDDLTARGLDTRDLKKQYLHIEDLARRGDHQVMRSQLKVLTATLDRFDEVDRDAKLDSLSGSASAAQ
jgi:hypothetical protein